MKDSPPTSIIPDRPPVKDRVSVIMPCYNCEVFVAEAIASVLGQTYHNVELIVIDDGSTDRSVDVIRRHRDKVHLIAQTNKGPSAARNRGLREATGEFIAYLDADDYWEPDFIQTMFRALENSPGVLAYCGWQNIGPDGHSLPPFIPPDYDKEDKRIALLQNAALWPIHATLTRRDALLQCGGFDETIPMCEDYDLWLRLAFAQPIVRVEQVLSYYRHHKALKVTDKRGRDAEYMRKIKQRFIGLNPSQTSDISEMDLRECVDGGFIRRGYQCYWNRELLSARRIFRTALFEGAISFRDLKYVLPALLPVNLYVALIRRSDKQQTMLRSSK